MRRRMAPVKRPDIINLVHQECIDKLFPLGKGWSFSRPFDVITSVLGPTLSPGESLPDLIFQTLLRRQYLTPRVHLVKDVR